MAQELKDPPVKDWEIAKAFDEGAKMKRTDLFGKSYIFNKASYPMEHQFDFTSFLYEIQSSE